MQGTVNLGPRLLRVASFVPDQAKLGDIGTDHAYLPIFLWEEKRIRQAVAVDVHKGPYQSALTAIQSRGLQEAIQVRFGDGLKPVEPGEVDTLTLAGMGGNTMLEIFAARPEVMKQVRTLILQPQGAEGKVRKALLRSGWLLREEQLVEEEGRIYGVIVFSREEGKSIEELSVFEREWIERLKQTNNPNRPELGKIEELFSPIFWDLGPMILKNPVSELNQMMREQIEPLQRAIQEMKKSSNPAVQDRINQQEILIHLLEEMRQWLFPLD